MLLSKLHYYYHTLSLTHSARAEQLLLASSAPEAAAALGASTREEDEALLETGLPLKEELAVRFRICLKKAAERNARKN